MKKLAPFSLTLLLCMPLLSFNFAASRPKNDSGIEVVFNNQLEFNDMVKIKLDMSQKGVVLNFKKLEFNAEGKLHAIDFFVDFKDGFSGNAFASGDGELDVRKSFGFRRDFSEDAAAPFETGNLHR